MNVIEEIRNIEYALNYFISISAKNKRVKPTRIFSNENNVLEKKLLRHAQSEAFQDYPELQMGRSPSPPRRASLRDRTEALAKKRSPNESADRKLRISLHVIHENNEEGVSNRGSERSKKDKIKLKECENYDSQSFLSSQEMSSN